MSDKAYLLVIVLVVLTTKHMVFDFCLQSLSQVKNKRIYGHKDGLLHAAGHAAGTAVVFFIILPPIGIAVAIVVGEFIVHYHLDWFKEQIGIRLALRMEQRGFWIAFGIDQWLHQLTYLAIAAVLVLN